MCTKARGGSKRGRALSRRRLGQHAGQCMALSQRERPMSRCRMVAKCSVMMGGQLVSRRRLFGCSGPKSGSAGSSWRPAEACTRRSALAGSWAASGGPPSHPISPFFAASALMASGRLWHMYQGARRLHAPPGALLMAARPTRWTTSQQSQLERPQSRRRWLQSAQ